MTNQQKKLGKSIAFGLNAASFSVFDTHGYTEAHRAHPALTQRSQGCVRAPYECDNHHYNSIDDCRWVIIIEIIIMHFICIISQHYFERVQTGPAAVTMTASWGTTGPIRKGGNVPASLCHLLAH